MRKIRQIINLTSKISRLRLRVQLAMVERIGRVKVTFKEQSAQGVN